MSDLFMTMQCRRWQHDAQPTMRPADINASTPRSMRASTPGPISFAQAFNQQSKIYDIPQINGGRIDDDDDDNDDDDDDEDTDNGNKNIERHLEDVAIDDDPLANILSLKLRKPKHWKWELTTSKSCTNIALPRILLYDHKGNLLVDAPSCGGNSSHEQIYKQEDFKANSPKISEKTKKRQYFQQRSATTNLTQAVRKALETEFDGLQIHEVRSKEASTVTTPPSSSTNTTMHCRPSRRPTIDFSSKDLSDISPRSSSAKGVRFHLDDKYEAKIPEFLPTPPSTTTPTSSSSGPREKRRYRRSHSSGRSSSRTPSILERFSYQKGRLSTPESEDERLLEKEPGPRYFLSTDEAGSLLVHQESSSSSHNARRRRKNQRYRTTSESNIHTPLSQHSPALSLTLSPTVQMRDSSNSSKALSGTSSRTSSKARRRKQLPLRRNVTEGDILADKHLSTSEEELTRRIEKPLAKQPVTVPTCPTLGAGCTCRQQRKYARTETKDLNSSISPLGVQRNGKIR